MRLRQLRLAFIHGLIFTLFAFVYPLPALEASEVFFTPVDLPESSPYAISDRFHVDEIIQTEPSDYNQQFLITDTALSQNNLENQPLFKVEAWEESAHISTTRPVGLMKSFDFGINALNDSNGSLEDEFRGFKNNLSKPAQFFDHKKDQTHTEGIIFNMSITLTPIDKTEVVFYQQWAKYWFDTAGSLGISEQHIFSNRYNYSWSNKWRTGVGYDIIYDLYDESGYTQDTMTYIPRAEIEFKATRRISFLLFTDVSLGRYGARSEYDIEEMKPVDSRTREVGFETKWKFKKVELTSGVTVGREEENLEYSDSSRVYTYYAKLKKRFELRRFALIPFVMVKEERKDPTRGANRFEDHFSIGLKEEITKRFEMKQSLTVRTANPHTPDVGDEKTELGMDLRYHVTKDRMASIFTHLAYIQPRQGDQPKKSEESQATATTGFALHF